MLDSVFKKDACVSLDTYGVEEITLGKDQERKRYTNIADEPERLQSEVFTLISLPGVHPLHISVAP